MKQARILIAAILLIIIVLAPTILVLNNTSAKNASNQPFYVGVTYCGSSVQEAKDLIDKVKDYTNLFVLQSYPLRNVADVIEIGDYVVASKLNFAFSNSRNIFPNTGNSDVHLSITSPDGYLVVEEEYVPAGVRTNELANTAKQRWGEQFIGVYYEDEPGGDMLDKLVDLTSASKSACGIITDYNTSTQYYPDGKVFTRLTHEINYSHNEEGVTWSTSDITYYPNGTITILELENGNYNFYTSKNITKYTKPLQSYKQVLKQNPIQNYDDAAKEFIDTNKARMERIDKAQLTDADILVFTADYGLYWWDYQSGYDMVLAELAWNHSVAQHIGLVRGAANLQGKSWGTCITWKYTQPPFLTDGEEMFEQMKISYETGAEYVLIFNYSEDPANPNTLQEEHFRALERFWKDVVQNPDVTHGGVKAEAVLVLPKNYGWGMRRSDHIEEDFIWGIWPEDDKAPEIWNQLESRINQYEVKLDIVFEDSNYPVTGKYDRIYYCGSSQTMFSSLTAFFTSFYVWVIGCVLLFSVAAGVVLIRFRHHKKQHN